MRRAGPIFAALLGLAGCVSNGAIPKSWSDAQKDSSSCDRLAGLYRNAGSEPRTGASQAEGSSHAVKLTSVLRFEGRLAGDAPEVCLSFDRNGVPTFTPVDAAGAPVSSAPRPVLTCSNGVLSWSGSVRALRTDNVGDPLVGPDRISFEIRRGSDGALYVETREIAAGLAYMFLPIGMSETNHFRFPAME